MWRVSSTLLGDGIIDDVEHHYDFEDRALAQKHADDLRLSYAECETDSTLRWRIDGPDFISPDVNSEAGDHTQERFMKKIEGLKDDPDALFEYLDKVNADLNERIDHIQERTERIRKRIKEKHNERG